MLRPMTVGTAVRSAVTIGWLINALLLERILTLGAITDVSGVGQNPPLFVATGASMLVLALTTALAVIIDMPAWPGLSLVLSLAFGVAGAWLRLENGDDSGAAIVLIALLIATLSRSVRAERRRTT